MDKLDPQDPARRDMQPPIPTHPPDPAARGEEDKVAGVPKDPSLHSVGLAPGAPGDAGVGGPGLGEAPQEDNAAGARARQTRAGDDRGRTG